MTDTAEVLLPSSPIGPQHSLLGDFSDSSFMSPPPQDIWSHQFAPNQFNLLGIQPLPQQHSMYKHHVLTVDEFTKEKVGLDKRKHSIYLSLIILIASSFIYHNTKNADESEKTWLN